VCFLGEISSPAGQEPKQRNKNGGQGDEGLPVGPQNTTTVIEAPQRHSSFAQTWKGSSLNIRLLLKPANWEVPNYLSIIFANGKESLNGLGSHNHNKQVQV
jgi:hypothetical protein